MKKIAIISTKYNLLLFTLIFKYWDEYLIVVSDEKIYNSLKKMNIQNIYYYRKIGLKRTPLSYYMEKIKFLYFLIKNSYYFSKVKIVGCDHLRYSFLKKRKYILIEDGLKNYQLPSNKLELKKIFFLESPFYKQMGYSSKIKKIYLTGLLKYPVDLKKKIITVNLKKLWSNKNKIEKKRILALFEINTNILKKIKNKKYILFTQPLSEDELLLETEKIEIYKKIIIKYSEENIVIKPHPRETTNYKNIFPKIEIIFENFPSEFLDLYDIKFEKIITLFSTAALNLARGNFKNLIFYGTRVHPKLLEKWGDSDLIMKANAFLEEE